MYGHSHCYSQPTDSPAAVLWALSRCHSQLLNSPPVLLSASQMGSFASAISPSSSSQLQNNRIFLSHSPFKFLNSPLNPHARFKKSFLFYSIHQPKPTLHISPNTFHQFQHLAMPSSHLTPWQSPKSFSRSPLHRISKFFKEIVVVLLVGSYTFMGFYSARSAMALTGQKNGKHTESLEEIREAQEGTTEDDEMYVKLVKDNPRNVDALKMVVNAKMRQGKTTEALLYVEQLIDIQPEEVEWRLLQALCYEMMGQFSKARTLFKQILKRRPLLIRALHGLAMVMHKNHEGPAVFEMLNKALCVAHREKRLTEERNIKILIAQMHVVKGELEEGLKKFQDLVNENPRDFRPYLCQGIIYSLLDKKEEAAEQFETYRSLIPEEFPQRGFLDDVVLAAKRDSKQRLEKDLDAEFSNKN